MVYSRPPGASARDFAAAREWEEEVGTWLPTHRVAELDASDRLDYWVPGSFIEAKEKRQPLSARWHVLPGVPEVDLFVIDELSVRRALRHFPSAYFVLRDLPGGRVFMARVDEMACAEHARLQRGGKGKWVVNLRNFRLLADPRAELMQAIFADQVSMPWKRSECLTMLEVPQA